MGCFTSQVSAIDKESRFCLHDAGYFSSNGDNKQIFRFAQSFEINTDAKQQQQQQPALFWRPSSHLMSDLLLSGFCRNSAIEIHRISDDLFNILSEFVGHCDVWDMERYLLNRSWKAIKECLNDEYMIRKLVQLEQNSDDDNFDAVTLTNRILEDEEMQIKIQEALPDIHMVPSFNGIMMVLLKDSQHTIYGSRLVQTGECHEWTVKIASIWKCERECIQIGLIKNDKDILYKYEYTGYWANQRKKPFDGYLFDGQLGTISPPKNGKYYGCEFGKVGDVVTMKLERDKISYIVNGVDYGVAFEGIDDAVYRLAVCVVYKGTRVELL